MKQRTYAGVKRPDTEREPPDCDGCRHRDAMLEDLQRETDQYMAWYAQADDERRQAQAEVESLLAARRADEALMQRALETLEDIFGERCCDIGVITDLRKRLGGKE